MQHLRNTVKKKEYIGKHTSLIKDFLVLISRSTLWERYACKWRSLLANDDRIIDRANFESGHVAINPTNIKNLTDRANGQVIVGESSYDQIRESDRSERSNICIFCCRFSYKKLRSNRRRVVNVSLVYFLVFLLPFARVLSEAPALRPRKFSDSRLQVMSQVQPHRRSFDAIAGDWYIRL